MAKGQKKSKREAKKPKQVKPKVASPASPFGTDQSKSAAAGRKNK